MTDDFSNRRRQRFISEPYYTWLSGNLVQSIDKLSRILPANGSDEQKLATAASFRASDRFELLMLRYTAGEPIALLRAEMDGIVAEYEQAVKWQGKAQGRLDWPAFRLSELAEYERAMQLIGLCFLLHRQDLLPRIAALEDPLYRGRDALYEDLLDCGLDGRLDVDVWFHESYRNCVNSMYGDSDDESLADLNAYLEKWYSSMSSADWHDSHLDLSEKKGLYFGYWAIEAAAVAFLLGVDDTSLREHHVYPKDLGDFARAFEPEEKTAAAPEGSTLRTGQVCPETGIWKAVGYNVPGVLVQTGERMPEVFAPDRSGAHRPQAAVWEFGRKA
ncbi:PoNe immunity protein domain-containing protein [Paraburkholderia bannensis]|uniref:PoNe immunity protein domain-containing protein n=1 Tax=Paraburkholderia bannensis TaxID=765414 RepID=UPI002ABDD004|nr:PoNe immunity protein domain-containing protein [Paraburkholderia bannensis]